MSLELTVQRIETVNSRIRVLILCPADHGKLPAYSAGAHIDVDTGAAGTRSYSLINFTAVDATPDHYCIAVQREDDGQGGSAAMHQLKVGDTISSGAPKNEFPLRSGQAQVLLLGGGIGLTPLISMATELQAAGRKFQLHYTARNSDAMAFLSELTENFGSCLHLYQDDEQALVLADLFASVANDTHVYLCGPAGLINAARTSAEVSGFAAGNIHSELFSTPQGEVGDLPFEIELQSTGQAFTVPVGKTIIEVLEAHHVDVIYDCQRGDCGICQTDVVSGTPDHRDVVLSEAERLSGKVMQICVSRAKSARLVLDL